MRGREPGAGDRRNGGRRKRIRRPVRAIEDNERRVMRTFSPPTRSGSSCSPPPGAARRSHPSPSQAGGAGTMLAAIVQIAMPESGFDGGGCSMVQNGKQTDPPNVYLWSVAIDGVCGGTTHHRWKTNTFRLRPDRTTLAATSVVFPTPQTNNRQHFFQNAGTQSFSNHFTTKHQRLVQQTNTPSPFSTKSNPRT